MLSQASVSSVRDDTDALNVVVGIARRHCVPVSPTIAVTERFISVTGITLVAVAYTQYPQEREQRDKNIYNFIV